VAYFVVVRSRAELRVKAAAAMLRKRSSKTDASVTYKVIKIRIRGWVVNESGGSAAFGWRIDNSAGTRDG
jgi:hypothetical protein